MKYLVTGGAGFIGSNFIRFMLKNHRDCRIVNLDKLTYAGNLRNLEEIEADDRYEFVKGDIADETLVDRLMANVEAVVHFAAESHVDRSISDPGTFVKTNVWGTHVLLEAALKHGLKRFHHISTDEVFGALPLDNSRRFTLDTPYDPSSPYSASKAGSDHLARAYFKTFGLPVTITNCSNNYGPYQFPEKLIPHMILKAIRNERLPVYGKGENVRDWIHVEDHCRAIDLVLQKGAPGETYLVGGNEERTNLAVVKLILKYLGKGEDLIEFVKDRPGHDLRYAIDSSRIEQELNFKRHFNFEDGLEQTVDWYLDNRDWVANLESRTYSQVK
ncbi:MAG: dTDP-glucose 4,6-dehydratase [Candidatus Saccharibacteria bacterium]